MQRPETQGFTLIELMIVVVVIALLSTIALPSYLEHLAKSRRAEGRNALLKAAQLQERFYSTFTPAPGGSLRYANSAAEVAALFGTAGTVYSGENPALNTGHYTLTVSFPSGCPDTSCFQMNAAPQGRHAPDAKCGTLTLDARGNRGKSGTESLEYCWGK